MSKLLLVIDMQEGFKSPTTDAILPTILKLLDNFSGEVVFAKFANLPYSRFERQLNWKMFQNETEQQLLIELQPTTRTTVKHNSYTVLNDELINFLKEKSVSTVYLCGIYTDVCVTKAAMDLFDRDIDTFVIKDACGSLHGQYFHDVTIVSLGHILGENHIISSDIVCQN